MNELITDEENVIQRWLISRPNGYYVYILRKPNGTPFYVGKGRKRRILDHEAEARGPEKTHKLNTIRAISKRGERITYEIESYFPEEEMALSREVDLIALIGRHDLGLGPLTNQTDGGEGTSNPSEESKERHRNTLSGIESDDSERRAVNTFFHKIMEGHESVAVKPLSSFKARPISAHPQSRTPTPRQATALIASAVANRVMLEADCRIPRRMKIGGINSIIENGVSRDIIKSGLALMDPDSNPTDEIFILSEKSVQYVVSCIDKSILLDAGILLPEVRVRTH